MWRLGVWGLGFDRVQQCLVGLRVWGLGVKGLGLVGARA